MFAFRKDIGARAVTSFPFQAEKLALRALVLVLVHRLAYNGDVAAGQLAVFQGASEAPISESYGSSEQRGKTADRPRPGGLR